MHRRGAPCRAHHPPALCTTWPYLLSASPTPSNSAASNWFSVAASSGPTLLHKVQVKGRWTIDRKYIGRDIWIAFPIGSDWYLVPHDVMVAWAEADGATKTASWIDGGLLGRYPG